ncbi:hypothetical protein QT969_10485 [Rhodococcus sp. CSLK01-03]|uniref:Capsid maturation protease n=1 Tax=Rhodococcus indonesiensis TaxID=3055869 RepID=A0ABT7RM47_9NOCA|nr:hypothetical protein [Rhodococcus indonesiensis]MDM7488718.1 hypothetical protein [Rhodococcus indonesiensis]
MPSPSERNEILKYLHTLAIDDVVKLWRSMSGMDLHSTEFRAMITEAYPEIATQWANVASELALGWYNDSAPELDYRAVPAPPPTTEQLASSASWALSSSVGEGALSLLAGSLQRAVWNGARDTLLHNADAEAGSRWARHASANACDFCKVLATRGAVYASAESAGQVVGRGKEMSLAERRARARGETRISGRFIAKGRRTRREDGQKMGDKFHDNCHCAVIEVRPGGSYEPAPYVEQWDQLYIDATRKIPDGDPITMKAVLANMRQLGT